MRLLREDDRRLAVAKASWTRPRRRTVRAPGGGRRAKRRRRLAGTRRRRQETELRVRLGSTRASSPGTATIVRTCEFWTTWTSRHRPLLFRSTGDAGVASEWDPSSRASVSTEPERRWVLTSEGRDIEREREIGTERREGLENGAGALHKLGSAGLVSEEFPGEGGELRARNNARGRIRWTDQRRNRPE